MLCTALTLLPAFVYNIKLAFLLIPAITCSYMPCRYSSHVILADGPVFSSYDNWARKQSSHLVRPPFLVLKVFVVWMDGCWLRVLTLEILLMRIIAREQWRI